MSFIGDLIQQRPDKRRSVEFPRGIELAIDHPTPTVLDRAHLERSYLVVNLYGFLYSEILQER